MKIDLREYEGQSFPGDLQKQIVATLVMHLRYYIKAPIIEFENALPRLEALEKQCQEFDALQGKRGTNYIMEIIAALHEEEKNRVSNDTLKDDDDSLFWKMIMTFKEKIIKIKKP